MRASITRIVDALTTLPALVVNGPLDVVYANPLAEALYLDLLGGPARPPNMARYLFLDPRARTFYPDWDTVAHEIVAMLRGAAGRTPSDRALSDLVGLLSTRSDDFRVLWASHDVRFHRTGTKRFRHPLVGEFALTFDSIPLPADTDSRSSCTRPTRARPRQTPWASLRDGARREPRSRLPGANRRPESSRRRTD